MPGFSKEAMERPFRTLQAVGVLRGKVEAIERATAKAQEDEVVVAVVQHDLNFGGVWTLAREGMIRQIYIVEDEGGWSLIFSAGDPLDQIGQRCDELAKIVQKRGEAMQRYANRHPHSENK